MRDYKRESIRRTLDRMYTCRDLEISNLWQRSIFLGTFLVLCFTGYGVLLDSILKIEDTTSEKNLLFHFICSILAMFSIVFSILWIQMAKGSKAWYEVYETYISKFQEELDNHKGLQIESEYGMGNHNQINMNDRLFSPQAGGYSPSKINIAIGQVSFITWTILLISHTILFFTNYLEIYFDLDILCCVFIGILVLFLWFIICIFNTKKANAKIISKQKKEKKKRCPLFQSKFFRQVRSGFLHHKFD